MHPLPEVRDQSEVGRRTHNIIIWPCQLMEAYKFGKGVTGTVQNSPVVSLNKKYDKNMYQCVAFKANKKRQIFVFCTRFLLLL
jgi:hypothetical protein